LPKAQTSSKMADALQCIGDDLTSLTF